MTKYMPISCDFYDELEALATLGKMAHIHYLDEYENPTCIEGIITDFKIVDKAEFMVLSNGSEIRLDHLIMVNQLLLSEWTNC